ncbi:20581_t:CDS:1 [Funneliformis geosporum]|uniref:13197_t:CDS:1 n=1 Tax=Funneliformis geosporum TaxID=1117311 RepID=A0A9W4SYA9_9GLOM|nr:20581_t:CDS:1 [Funneliformis geosporum]CAI2185825.1 13197_t:CDS:1 [Funneliformis geosporum]
MDEAMKKYCHLLFFDISGKSQEKGLKNNNDNVRPILNDSSQPSQKMTTTIAQTNLPNKSIKQRKPRAKKPKRTPRPPNAFILYRKAKQPDVIAQNNHLSNADVSKVISKMWWKEPENEKLEWEKMADKIKLKHMQTYPDYVYQPNKLKKQKSARGASFSVAHNSSKLSEEVINEIAEMMFNATNKTNSLPSPPPSADKPFESLHNHTPNYEYSKLPPTPVTEVYDNNPQYLLSPSNDDYISHGYYTPQQDFNPIFETSYDSHLELLGNNFDSFLDAKPVDKFSSFNDQDAHAASINSFDDVTLVDNYADSSMPEFFNNGAKTSPMMIDTAIYFDACSDKCCDSFTY